MSAVAVPAVSVLNVMDILPLMDMVISWPFWVSVVLSSMLATQVVPFRLSPEKTFCSSSLLQLVASSMLVATKAIIRILFIIFLCFRLI